MNALASDCTSPITKQASEKASKGIGETIGLVLVAATAFHLAYLSESLSVLIVVYFLALLRLARAERWRTAFYGGLGVGLLVAVGKLDFFWRIFSGGAIALWLVYAIWIGVFTGVARLCLRQFSPKWSLWLLPFLWCGFEYFRSELYYLRFAWLTPGLSFGSNPSVFPFHHLGTYGIGFVLMVIACATALTWRRSRTAAALATVAALALLRLWGWGCEPRIDQRRQIGIRMAGIQMEFPTENEVRIRLNELSRQHPEAELVVLSEYTFAEPIPETVKAWCRENRRFLIVGGKDPVSKTSFYNTAFVISPAGQIIFRQAKSVPIQFFNDGLPAQEQQVWNSPWGKIGICICYDLSYTRVTDRLIRQGAQALIVPTMDVVDWGQRQHELHARIAPTRAAEYHVPIFRLASSGISQAINDAGRVVSTAPFPGDGAVITATLNVAGPGRRPLDRWLAPFATVVTVVVSIVLLTRSKIVNRKAKQDKL